MYTKVDMDIKSLGLLKMKPEKSIIFKIRHIFELIMNMYTICSYLSLLNGNKNVSGL